MYTRNDNPNRKALEEGVSCAGRRRGGGGLWQRHGGGNGVCLPHSHPAITFSPTSMPITEPPIAARSLFALETGSGLRRHERPAVGEKSAAAKHKTGLDGNAVESAPENCRSGGRERRSRTKPARFAFATTPGRRSFSGHSISAPISFIHSTTKYFGGHCDVLGGIIVAKRGQRVFPARPLDSIFGRRGPLALRLLAGSARNANAAVADASALAKTR